MKKLLVFCLLVGSPVFGAAVRERVQAVVAENNTNVERSKNLYKFLPVPLVNIVFGYMRTKIERYAVSEKGYIDWIIVFNKARSERRGKHVFVDKTYVHKLSPECLNHPWLRAGSMAVVDQNTLRGLKFLGDGDYGLYEQEFRKQRRQMREEEARRLYGKPNADQEARDISDAWYNKEKRELDAREEKRLAKVVVRGKISEKNLLDCRELTVPGVEAVFLAKEQYGENFVLLNDGQN